MLRSRPVGFSPKLATAVNLPVTGPHLDASTVVLPRPKARYVKREVCIMAMTVEKTRTAIFE